MIGMVMNIKLKIHTIDAKKNYYLGNITINRGSLHGGFYKLSPHEFNSKFNTMLDTNIEDVLNFIGTSLSSMRK